MESITDVSNRLDRLESQLEQQQETITEQRAIIEDQRERITDLEADPDGDEHTDETVPGVSRRGALTAGGLLALLFGGVGTASADSQGQVGTASDPLRTLSTEQLTLVDSPYDGTSDETVTTLKGEGLTISSDALTVDTGEGLEIANGSVAASATEMDATADFSGPSLSQTNTTVSNGDLVLQDSVELESLTNSVSNNSETQNLPPTGAEISVAEDFDQLRVGIGFNTSGATRVSLRSAPTTIEIEKSFPGGGGSVTFDYAFTGGETYYVTVEEENDNEWTWGYDFDSPTQITGNIVSIDSYGDVDVGQWNAEQPARVIREITPLGRAIDGEATVEWSNPGSVSRWETATFQDVPDGETVEVYVETSSDGGSTWSDWRSEPIGSGTDLSAIPSDDRIRFRVELSRNDPDNEPRITLLSRQWRP